MEAIDISDKIDVEDMNMLCPLCDNAINDWDAAVVVTAYGFKGLAHSMCVAEEE